MFEGVLDIYLWQNVEGYKVDPQEVAGFGIQPESLETFLEDNKVVLQEAYREVKNAK